MNPIPVKPLKNQPLPGLTVTVVWRANGSSTLTETAPPASAKRADQDLESDIGGVGDAQSGDLSELFNARQSAFGG